MFHVELRQFPRNTHAFNLTDRELYASVLAPWTAERTFELAGQKWRPDEARLTILQGPQLQPHETSMGRGWANALKRSSDVTETVLSQVAPPESADSDGFAGYKAELLARSVEEPFSPRHAWQLAGRWLPSGPAAERLAMAERAVRELLAEDHVLLGRGTPATAAAHPVPAADLDMILHAWETWADERPGVFLCAADRSGAAPA